MKIGRWWWMSVLSCSRKTVTRWKFELISQNYFKFSLSFWGNSRDSWNYQQKKNFIGQFSHGSWLCFVLPNISRPSMSVWTRAEHLAAPFNAFLRQTQFVWFFTFISFLNWWPLKSSKSMPPFSFDTNRNFTVSSHSPAGKSGMSRKLSADVQNSKLIQLRSEKSKFATLFLLY